MARRGLPVFARPGPGLGPDLSGDFGVAFVGAGRGKNRTRSITIVNPQYGYFGSTPTVSEGQQTAQYHALHLQRSGFFF